MMPVMLQTDNETPRPQQSGAEVFERVDGDIGTGFLILCDHARPALPPAYGDLGLDCHEFTRHIAFDVGARDVTMGLAERLGYPAVLSCFSRLLIDPNRGEDDPTLIMRIADGAIIPANARIGGDEIKRRIERYYRPYHRAIDDAIGEAVGAGVPPALFSIHSFTPRFRGVDRPWHATVLWDSDPRLPIPLLEALEAEPGLVTGENVPYSGRLLGDTLYRHGTRRGLAHALIEIRQDLIGHADGVAEWVDRLAPILRRLERREGLNEVRHYGGEQDIDERI